MISRWLVYWAYWLKASVRYKQIKVFFYDVLENPDSRSKAFFDIFMIFLVLVSVSLLIFESRHEYDKRFDWFESGVVVVFVVEYLLRGWLYSDHHADIVAEYEKALYLNLPFRLKGVLKAIFFKKLSYVVSPFALIDLLAILPSFRELRFLRIFVIFRLFKLFRYSNSIKIFTDVLASKRFELTTLLMFMGFLVVVASLAIYLFENPEEGGQIENLYSALYWAIVTVSTVGYGDISPQTNGGRLVAMVLILSGLGVLSFFASIIVSAFNEKMQILRENNTLAELERFDAFVIICGFGRVGQEIARQFHQDKMKFIIIDKSEASVLKARHSGYLAIQDDASKNSVLLNAGLKSGATALLCSTGDDIANVYITLSSRYLNQDITIISRVNSIDNEKKLYQAGANHVIRPFEIAGLLAAEYVGQPVAFEAILGILQERRHIRMEILMVQSGSLAERRSLQELSLPRYKLKLIGVISGHKANIKHQEAFNVKNKHFYFNPSPTFIVQAEDMLLVLGRDYSIEYFRDRLEQSGLKKAQCAC